MGENKKAEPAPEILTMYHLEPAPPNYAPQRYIELYFAEKDSRYFAWYLHFYEPTLNKIVRAAAEHYKILHHFEDLKAEAVMAMLEALRKYQIESGIPFSAFQKRYIDDAIENYIRINRDGFITMTRDTYPVLKKVMALFYKNDGHTDDESICKISDAMGISTKTVRTYLAIGLLNKQRAEAPQNDEDEDDSEEDFIPDPSGSAEQMYFRAVAEGAAHEAFLTISYRERRIVAQRLAFCSECLSTREANGSESSPIPAQSFFDIAISHGLSTAEAAEKAYHAALQKMKEKMAQDEEYVRVFGIGQ